MHLLKCTTFMKNIRILTSVAALLIAVSLAFTTTAKPLVLAPEEAYFKDPDITHCTDALTTCVLNAPNQCSVTAGNVQGYRLGCSVSLGKP